MESLNIILSAKTTDFHTDFASPLILDPERSYELALVSLETYYSYPNVNDGNNKFVYSNDQGHTWEEIRIPEGAYEVSDINEYLKSIIGSNALEILPNVNTLKCQLKINEDRYQVDFTPEGTLRDVLGFAAEVYDKSGEGERTVDILSLNSILVHCDVVGGSYVNGQSHPTIYSFFPNVAPGSKIVEVPHNLVYLPVTRNVIRNIRVWLTSQDRDELLNLRGETVTIRLHLRSVK